MLLSTKMQILQNKYSYTQKEIKLFKKLNTPQKIQDYINKIPFNFDERHDFCLSPKEVLKKNKADCIEGAFLASAILEFHGYKPLVVDLRSTKKPYDYDHVIAVFKIDGFWGTISKTNHSVLRYREPIYKNIRELVMSYFHEYFLDSGLKTLREYSLPINMNRFNETNWRTTEKSLSKIMEEIDRVRHIKILSTKQEKNLRKADKIEIEATKVTEFNNRAKPSRGGHTTIAQDGYRMT